MARVERNTVSYFPHDAHASQGDTLTIIQSRYGNNGYAVWFKLLEKLASTDGHYLDCRNPIKWKLLIAQLGTEEITIVEILNLLVEMQALDKELWNMKVIWSQHLVDNLTEVYKNRRREIPQRPVIATSDNAITTGNYCIICGKNITDMRTDAEYCSSACRQIAYRKRNAVRGEKPIITDNNPITTGNNGNTTSSNTQSRVEENKVNKSRVEDTATTTDEKLKKITSCYENNIGQITQMVADELRFISEKFPAGWFELAVKEAIDYNKRRLGYVKTILERWAVEGLPAKNGGYGNNKGGKNGKYRANTEGQAKTKDYKAGWGLAANTNDN